MHFKDYLPLQCHHDASYTRFSIAEHLYLYLWMLIQAYFSFISIYDYWTVLTTSEFLPLIVHQNTALTFMHIYQDFNIYIGSTSSEMVVCRIGSEAVINFTQGLLRFFYCTATFFTERMGLLHGFHKYITSIRFFVTMQTDWCHAGLESLRALVTITCGCVHWIIGCLLEFQARKTCVPMENQLLKFFQKNDFDITVFRENFRNSSDCRKLIATHFESVTEQRLEMNIDPHYLAFPF